MRANTVVDVGIHRPVDAYGVGLWEDGGVAVGADEAAEDVVARFYADGFAAVIDGGGDGGAAVGAEGAV